MSHTDGPYVERRETTVEGQAPLAAPAAATRVAAAPVAVAPMAAQRVRTDRVMGFAADSVVTGLVGLALLLLGLVVVTRAGIDSPLRDPVVEVLGFSHTALLGFVEAGFGLLLLLSAAARSRGGEVLFGSLLGVGGFVAAVQADSFRSAFAVESGFAWLVVIAAVVVVLAALALPRYASSTTAVDTRAS